jgi:tRNA (guanine10-N2)-dimethyltransferase
VLDPFCGTGGIAIEAALIGARALASDIDPRMVAGARANLRHLGLSAEVGRLDARCLDEAHEPGSVDAIATDPPYGRAASTWGAGVEGLLAEALPAALAVLRPGGRMCLAVPDEVPIERLARDVGFKYLFGARLRVHGSLTRHICVAERPG